MSNRLQGSQARKILLIESNASVRISLHNVLEAYGHNVTSRKTGEAGIPAAIKSNYNAVICNQHLAGISGLEFFAKMHPLLAHSTTVLTAALAGDYLSNRAHDLGIKIFMEKPFKIERLMECIANDTSGASSGLISEHIYYTNYGRIISICPPETESLSAEKETRQPPFSKSINRMGRKWKVYLNHERTNTAHGHGVPKL